MLTCLTGDIPLKAPSQLIDNRKDALVNGRSRAYCDIGTVYSALSDVAAST
jgi:hypothetical protein